MIKDYSDIIDLPHHQSAIYPHMSQKNRAAQFAPFAALTGHMEAVAEAERLTTPESVLSEDMKMELDYILQQIVPGCCIYIKYFEPDQRKTGGVYKEKVGEVYRINLYKQSIIFQDKSEVKFKNIIHIECRHQSG